MVATNGIVVANGVAQATVALNASAMITGADYRQAFINIGWDGVTPLQANMEIVGGTVLGSTDVSVPGLLISGPFPAGSQLALAIDAGATVCGAAAGAFNASGGTAIKADVPVTVTNIGVIRGGSGGLGVIPSGTTAQAGLYIEGNANVTWAATGTRLGRVG